jgi:arginine-tRNA-protein transferase
LGELVATSLNDRLSDGLSAVYSCFDPAVTKRSLGTFTVLQLIRQAQAEGLSFVYLGYWIQASPKMAYKVRFQPLQALRGDGWQLLKV